MHVSQIIILYTLKLYTTVCQLQLNKAEKNALQEKKGKRKPHQSQRIKLKIILYRRLAAVESLVAGWHVRLLLVVSTKSSLFFLLPHFSFSSSFYSFSPFLLSYYLCYSPMCNASTSTWCQRFLSFIKPIGKDCPQWVTLNSIENLWEALRMPQCCKRNTFWLGIILGQVIPSKQGSWGLCFKKCIWLRGEKYCLNRNCWWSHRMTPPLEWASFSYILERNLALSWELSHSTHSRARW